MMVAAEVAALGVDNDCGTCAMEGIRRLREARPDLDWIQIVHDVQEHAKQEEDGYFENRAYWCPLCHPGEEG